MKRFGWSWPVLLLVGSSFAHGAQGEVEIVHHPIQCWPVDRFLMIQSSFVPPDDIQTAKFYFRSTDQPDYYFVELTLGPGGGRGIAPKAEPFLSGATYYIEIVTKSFSAFRSEERSVPIASGEECQKRDPETAFYTGENPDIAIGATRMGAAPLPPGFQPDGIARFLNATGIAGDVGGGGMGGGKTIALIGGGGAGAAALFLLGGGSAATTTSPVGGNTTSVGTSSTTTTAIGGVTTTTTTGGGGGSSTSTVGAGSTTTVFGSTTTTVVGGSTTTIIGSSTTTSVGPSSTTTSIGTSTTTSAPSTTTSAGTSTTTSAPSTTTSAPSTTTRPSTTTSAPSTTTSVPSTTTRPSTTTSAPTTTTSVSSTTTKPSTTTTAASGADMRLDSISDSPDPVVTGGLVSYTIRVTNLGQSTAPSVLISLFLDDSDCPKGGTGCSAGGCGFAQCSVGSLGPGQSASRTSRIQLNGSGTHTVRAQVGGGIADPNLGNNTQSESTLVTASQRTSEHAARVVELQSTLDVPPHDGRIRARITLNDAASEETSNTGPRIHRFGAQAGENRVAAQVQLGKSDSGIWRLDLGSTRTFVPGSLRVESGQVVSQDASSITFGLHGGTNDLRFTLQLSESIH